MPEMRIRPDGVMEPDPSRDLSSLIVQQTWDKLAKRPADQKATQRMADEVKRRIALDRLTYASGIRVNKDGTLAVATPTGPHLNYAYDEAKHPRDDVGRWTEAHGDGTHTIHQNVPLSAREKKNLTKQLGYQVSKVVKKVNTVGVTEYHVHDHEGEVTDKLGEDEFAEMAWSDDVAPRNNDEAKHPRNDVGEARRSAMMSWAKKDKIASLPFYHRDYGTGGIVVNLGGTHAQNEAFRGALSNALGRDVEPWREGFNLTVEESRSLGLTKEQDGKKLLQALKTARYANLDEHLNYADADAVDAAAALADPDATEAQRKAGTYRKGHVTLHGLNVTIETAAGQRRRPEWPPLKNHYGYIKRTKSAADGDHVDVFLGPNPESELVFVIDQLRKDRSFDEHKVMVGFTNAAEAKEAYLDNYEKGWTGFGGMKAMTVGAFKEWLKTGDTGSAAEPQLVEYADAQWDEHKHPRGQPKNKGQFGPGGGGRTSVGSQGAQQGRQPAWLVKAMAADAAAKAAKGSAPVQRLSAPAQPVRDPVAVAKDDYAKNGTKAASFKAWFGDWEHDAANASKVVNKDGEPQETHEIPGTGSQVKGKDGKPIAVYHGTSRGGFMQFDKSKLDRYALYGPGFYFTEDENIAKEYQDKGTAPSTQEIKPSSAEKIEQFVSDHLPDWWQISERSPNDPKNQSGAPKDIIYKDTSGAFTNMRAVDRVGASASIRTENLFKKIPDAFGWGDEMRAKWQDFLSGEGVMAPPNPETKSVYLNIRKPFDLNAQKVSAKELALPPKFIQSTLNGDENAAKTVDEWKEHFDEEWFPKEFIEQGFGEYIDNKTAKDPYAITTLQTYQSHYMRTQIQKLGYDGFTHIGGDRTGGGHHHRVWIAFEPNQIKSVANRGTFDPAQDRIDYVHPHREWIEELERQHHPRDAGGKFTTAPGGHHAAAKAEPAQTPAAAKPGAKPVVKPPQGREPAWLVKAKAADAAAKAAKEKAAKEKAEKEKAASSPAGKATAPDKIRAWVEKNIPEKHVGRVVQDLIDVASGTREGNKFEKEALAQILGPVQTPEPSPKAAPSPKPGPAPKTEPAPKAAPKPIRKGQQVRIKPEFSDPGENTSWIALEDEDGGRVMIKEKTSGVVQRVGAHMVEPVDVKAETKPEQSHEEKRAERIAGEFKNIKDIDRRLEQIRDKRGYGELNAAFDSGDGKRVARLEAEESALQKRRVELVHGAVKGFQDRQGGSDKFKPGDLVRISAGSGLDSGIVATVISRGQYGAKIDPREEALRADDGRLLTMFRSRLIHIEPKVEINPDGTLPAPANVDKPSHAEGAYRHKFTQAGRKAVFLGAGYPDRAAEKLSKMDWHHLDDLAKSRFTQNIKQDVPASGEAEPDQPVKIMGEDMHLAETQEIDGITFDRYETASGGAVVQTDKDSGNVIQVKKYPTSAALNTGYGDLVGGARKMSQAGVPRDARPTEPGFSGTTVDSLGREYHWVNGVRVPGHQEQIEKPIHEPTLDDIDAAARAATDQADIETLDLLRSSLELRDQTPDDDVETLDTLNESIPKLWEDVQHLLAKTPAVPQPEIIERPATEQTTPRVALAHTLGEKLASGEKITSDSLLKYADQAHGGTRGQGKHDPSGVYDSLEAGMNLSLEGKTNPTLGLSGAIAEAERIKALVDALPTQTNRSGKKESMQQFSTPPHYAYAIAWLANLNSSDLVGEPSAGTGCLAMQAKNAGAKVVTNEFDPDRAEFLRDQFGAENVSLEDGEQLGAIWPSRGIRPTAVVMNPPFSQTAGRMGDKMTLMTGANHVQQALQSLQPGGRLVAIVGGGFQRVGGGRAGMAPESPTYAEWFRKLSANGYELRANVGVSGGEYKKYGTHFGTRVLVIDKTSNPRGGIVPTGDVSTIPELMTMLEEVRNDRPQVDKRAPGDGAGTGISGAPPAGGAGKAGGDGGSAGGSAPADSGPTTVPFSGPDRDVGSIDAPGGYPGDSAYTGGDNELVGGRPQHDGPGDAADAQGSGVAGAEGAPGHPGGAPKKRRKGGGSGGSGGGGRRAGAKSPKRTALNIPQLVYDQLGELRPAAPVSLVSAPIAAVKDDRDNSELGTSVYDEFKPSVHVEGMRKHVTALVESAAMAAVKLPNLTYRPVLSPDAVENKRCVAQLPDGSVVETNLGLSEAALETVCLMGQAHEQWLPAEGGGDSVKHGAAYTNPQGETWIANKREDGKWFLEADDTIVPIKARPNNPGFTGITHDSLGREYKWVNGVRVPGDKEQEPIRKEFRDKDELERLLGSNWVIGMPSKTAKRFKPAGQPYRRGALNGDGTGSGKGRSVAGVLLDNINQGRTKHVWLSKNFSLMSDARRDMADIGLDPSLLFDFKQLRGANPPKDGICFITYPTLASGKKADANGPGARNIDTLVEWLGKDFEGVIAFDEAHAMANSTGAATAGRMPGKPAAMAVTGVALQAAMPKARVGYWTATAATEPTNMLYCDRLGLWGPGTDFENKAEFVGELGQGGNATLEAVAQSMKAMGMYNARMIGLDDGTNRKDETGRFVGKVEAEPLQASLTEDQKQQYDGAAEGWQHVMQKLDEIVEHLGGKASGNSQFWGAQQRFFNQVLTCMATPAVLRSVDADLEAGRAPVIQLVNTMEASQDRVIKNRDEDTDLDEVDVGPKEILINFIDQSIPTNRIEDYVPDPINNPDRVAQRPVRTTATAGPAGVEVRGKRYAPGEIIPRDVLDEALGQDIIGGELVHDEFAIAEKARLRAQAEALRIPESPLDQIIHKYGIDTVAEITGRSERFVWDHNDVKGLERRSDSDRDGDTAAFQEGRKKILVFSGAGNTGKSYHADKRAKNQGRRVHYVLQPGWSATPLVQALGRCNRANQTTYPIIRPVGIPEVPGNKRFISSAARRLESMGALTRGQRQAAGGGGAYGAADNLESPEAVRGLHSFWFKMQDGLIPDLPFEQTLTKLGYDPYNSEGEPMSPPKITQFLNRILILPLKEQNRVFDEFSEAHQAMVAQAVRENTLDRGVENWPAEKIFHNKTETIYKHPASGAEAQLVTVKSRQKAFRREWRHNVEGMDKPVKFVKNSTSGKIWSVYEGSDATDPDTGRVYRTYLLKGVQGLHHTKHDRDVIDDPESNYKQVTTDEAKRSWEAEYEKAPQYKETEESFVTGALMPIWKKLSRSADNQIFRLKLDTGRTIVGRHVYPDLLPQLMASMGLHREAKVHDPATVHAQLVSGDLKHIKFDNGWKVKKSRAGAGGEDRLELIGPNIYDRSLLSQGVLMENIGGKTRFFIPTGPDGADVMASIAKNRPITHATSALEAEPTQYGETRMTHYPGERPTRARNVMILPSGVMAEDEKEIEINPDGTMAQPDQVHYADVQWDEHKHPRGQPKNAGQFGPGGGGAKKPAHVPAGHRHTTPHPAHPVRQAPAPQPKQRRPVTPASQVPPQIVQQGKDYVSVAMRNLAKTSRTAKGTVDTSASAGKADKMTGVTGAEASELATKNFEGVMRGLFELRGEDFSDPKTIMDLADNVNRKINQGITKEGVLLREDDSKFPYAKVADIPLARHQFAEEFARRLSDPSADPIETAAWVEWRVNIDHVYADGSGKTQRALAALPLMRANLPLPNYDDPKKFFKHMPTESPDPKKGPQSYTQGPEWDKYLRYYKMKVPAYGSRVVRQIEKHSRSPTNWELTRSSGTSSPTARSHRTGRRCTTRSATRSGGACPYRRTRPTR